MPSEFEKRLKHNMVDIQSSMMVGEDLLAYLMQDDILDFDLCEEIRVERTRKKKIVALLEMLPRKGPNAEASFIKALKNTGQAHVAAILERAGAPPPPTARPVEPAPLPSNDECDASNPRISFKLKSAPREIAMGINIQTKNYPMRRRPRGRAIVLNIVHYIPGTPNVPERRGAMIDEENIKELLQQLHFTVDVWNDVSNKEALEEKLKAERKCKDHDKADAFVFVMMAHGEEDHICLPCGSQIRISFIVEHFTGIKCAPLSGKPKLFFIQACQGHTQTMGVTQHDGPMEEGETESDAVSGNDKMISEVKDIYLAYATVPGYRAYRNTRFGSWFIRSVVEVFAQSAHKDTLDYMMTEVARMVGEKKDERGNLQCCRNVKTTDKHLYFLPGYFE